MSESSPMALAVSLGRGPLVGTFLGLILYGVTCMQAFWYFRTYNNDARRLKLTVAFLVVLETAHAGMSMWVMDDYLIVHYADTSALQSANWTSVSTYTLGLLIDFYVYLYFTWRVWLFSRSVWIVILMSTLSLSRTALSITATFLSVLRPTWSAYLTDYRTLILIGNTLFILGDTLSACAMAYHLHKYRSWTLAGRGGRPGRLDRLLSSLLIFAVATGALTSLVDVIALILTLSQPHGLAFLSAILVQTRVYANSLLASLNIRNAVSRTYEDPSDPLELPAISLRFAQPSDLSTTEADDGMRDHACDFNKSGAESWQTMIAQSRTIPSQSLDLAHT